MKKIVLSALLLAACNLANTAVAAGNTASATMQVSFVVQESCTVHLPDSATAAPAVTCAHAAPVHVSASATAAAPPVQAGPSQTGAGTDGAWQIYF